MPGAKVGRYSLITQIAAGGMANIWLAGEAGTRGFDRFVVIKRIADTFSQDPQFVDMFLDEARIAAQLNHPNIVQIYDLGEHAGAFFIAMEYLAGENLADILGQGNRGRVPLPVRQAVQIVADAAEALTYAHERAGADGKPLEIVHRDVSPQNIFVTYDGEVKVLDFGIAKAASRQSETTVGQLKGKMAYMSPEQARGERVDQRSDIFGLGIVMFEVLTHTRLFKFTKNVDTLLAISGQSPLPSIKERNPNVPDALIAICERALARDVRDRYQRMRDLHAALVDWLKSEPDGVDRSKLRTYMNGLFGIQMGERQRMLELAQRGDQSLHTHRDRPQPAPVSRVTMELNSFVAAATAPKRNRAVLVGTAVVSALLASGATALFLPAQRAGPGSTAAAKMSHLVVETEPEGARVIVDGVDRGASPVQVKGLSLGRHTVVASTPGHPPLLSAFAVEHEGERVRLLLRLPEREDTASAPAPSPPPSAAAATPASPPATTLATKVERSTAKARPQTRGRLSVDTSPWTTVYFDGSKLGFTPLLEVPMPAGTHRLKFVNEAKGISRTVELEIPPGKAVVKKYRF